MTIVLRGIEEIRGAAGLDLGVTDWIDVGPERVSRFEAALRPTAGGPPFAAVALAYVPEFLLLSLTNLFMPQLLEVDDVAMGVNYGTGEVRFPAPAPVGGRLRGSGRILEVVGVAGGAQTVTRIEVEAEGVDDPVCVVDAISRWSE